MSLGNRQIFFLLAPLAIVATAVAAALLDHALGSAVAAGLAFGVTAEAGVSRSRRCSRVVALAFVVAIGIGLSLGHRHDPLGQWAIYAVALAMVVEVVGARAARLHRSAITDPLTGLLDRQGLWESAGRAVRRCRRDGSPLTVVHIDLDEFKLVNDSFGHAAGDFALLEIAKRLGESIRATDVAARIGGDEFGLILDQSSEEGARVQINRLRFVLSAEPAVYDGHDIALSACFGVAMLRAGATESEILAAADRDMYRSKQQQPGVPGQR